MLRGQPSSRPLVAAAALALVALASCRSAPDATRPSASPTSVPSPSDEPAVSAFHPNDLTIAPDGTVYASDCGAGYVIRVEPEGALSIVAGIGVSDPAGGLSGDGGPATEAELDCPTGLAVDRHGRLLVADHANDRIRSIDREGTITTIAGDGPLGTAADSGDFVGDGGPAVKAWLQEPVGIAFDDRGNLLVADRDQHAIRSIAPDGTIATIAGTGESSSTGDGGPAIHATFASPAYAVAGPGGEVFVSDDEAMVIRVISRAGEIATFAGTGEIGYTGDDGPATAATFGSPEGLALDPSDGRLYVADYANHVIRVIDPDGTIRTIAGTGEPGCPTGGPAEREALTEPEGLALDRSGVLSIADATCGVVRLNSDGSLEVVASAIG